MIRITGTLDEDQYTLNHISFTSS